MLSNNDTSRPQDFALRCECCGANLTGGNICNYCGAPHVIYGNRYEESREFYVTVVTSRSEYINYGYTIYPNTCVGH